MKASGGRPARPGIFLDRDGTLIRNRNHSVEPGEIALLPGVVPALRLLRRAGYDLVVATNQAGIARGLSSPAEVRASGVHTAALLRARGVPLAGYYFSPYLDPAAGGIWAPFARASDARKPAPAMLLEAAADLGLDLSRCWMVGDTAGDAAAGLAAGTRAILLDIGAGAGAGGSVIVARNLPHAAVLILAADGRLRPADVALCGPALVPSVIDQPGGTAWVTGTPSRHPSAAWLARADQDGRTIGPLRPLPSHPIPSAAGSAPSGLAEP